MYNRQLGLFIGKIRADKKISMEKLCEGICTQSFLSAIEAGKKSTNKLMTDILLQRLGVSEDGYECYLSQIEHKRWQRRYKIIKFIENNDIDSAKKELELYKNDVGEKNKLHMQFILHMESRIILLEKKDYKLSYEKLSQAITLTIPRINKVNLIDLILSFKELFLIVECAKLGERVFNGKLIKIIYEKVIEYIEINECEELIRAKLYPKTVCLACKYWFLDNDYEKALRHCNNGLEYLQGSGKLYFMPEILENKKIALKSLINKYSTDKISCSENKFGFLRLEKEYQITSEWENFIKNLFLEYRATDEQYEWYPYFAIEIYFMGDIIKKRRNMLNISQEELASDICSTVTLSRIENGVTTLHPKIARQLLKKLKLSGEIYSAGIVSDDYEVHKLCHELEQLLLLNKHDEANHILQELEKKFDISNPINRQYFMHKKIVISKNLQIISLEEALKLFVEALNITIPKNIKFKSTYMYFSKKEIILMNNIATTLEKLKRPYESLKIYSMLDDYYGNLDFDISNNIITYELVMSNYGSLLGNIDIYEKSDEIAEKTIHESLKCRRGRFIIGFLYSKAWNIRASSEKNQKTIMQLSKKDLYAENLNKAYIMSCIMKDKVLENYICNIRNSK